MRQTSKQAAGTPTPKPIVTPSVLTFSSRSSIIIGGGGGANGRLGGRVIVGGGGGSWRQPPFSLLSAWKTTGSSTTLTCTPRLDDAFLGVSALSVATMSSASPFAWIAAVTRMMAAATVSETRARLTFSSSARLSAYASLSNVSTVPLTTTSNRTTVGRSAEATSAAPSSADIPRSMSSSTRASEGATLPEAKSLTRGATRFATTSDEFATAACRELTVLASTSKASLMSKFTTAFTSSLRPAPSTFAIAGSTSSCDRLVLFPCLRVIDVR